MRAARILAFVGLGLLAACHLARVMLGGGQSPEAAAAQGQLTADTVGVVWGWMQWACLGTGALAAGEATRRTVRHHRRKKAAQKPAATG